MKIHGLILVLAGLVGLAGCATVATVPAPAPPNPASDVCGPMETYMPQVVAALNQRDPGMSFAADIVVCSLARQKQFAYGIYKVESTSVETQALNGEIFLLIMLEKTPAGWQILGEAPVFGFVEGSAVVWISPSGSVVESPVSENPQPTGKL